MDNSPSLHLRRARVADAAQIAALASELGYPVTTADMASRLALVVPLANHLVVVADEGNRLGGWATAERRLLLVAGERIELMGLVVASASRRRGIGKALVGEVERWAAAQGFDTIIVRSNAARAHSHPFYESLAYIRNKTQHVYTKRLAGAVRADAAGARERGRD